MIRKIQSKDISRIYHLGTLYDPLFSNHYRLESYLDNELYIMNCYEEDSIIKGFVIANKLYEKIEILLIYVDKDYRRRGIAKQLLNDLENNNVDSILLEVSIQNISALKLYEKLGYETINIRSKYYNGVDAYVMKKVLK